MILISARSLPPRTEQDLEKYQQKINELPGYAQRVALAKREFSNKNKKTNRVFAIVRQTLQEMCSGSRRCMYCEDSCADEVEHFRPKDTYPEFTFVWENYLYVCGPCNGGKNDQFEVFDPITQKILNVSRRSTDPIVPPANGDPILLNPRVDDPMTYIALDLRDTFAFQPYPGRSLLDIQRAQQTIKILDLNRDVLLKSRFHAYGNYRARLREYIEEKAKGAPIQHLTQLMSALSRLPHPSVWREMQRQHFKIDELNLLFQQAPDALHW
jgi:uncharacterized protein (TIGR02646 family)